MNPYVDELIRESLMPTLLHISDLHRTSAPRVENDDLLMSFSSDSARWEEEGIPWPDVIVVSGDLVQGVSMRAEDPDIEIQAQYAEAADFLARLAEFIVEGDRSRIVIVPGNHDVHWGRAFRAMEPFDPGNERMSSASLDANSRIRWDWNTRNAYRITDVDTYMSRLEHFRKFRTDFYAGLSQNPIADNHPDLFFSDYQSLGLVIAGFASWHGNDCFCTVGEIEPAALLEAQRLMVHSASPVGIAVWHHGVFGGPRTSDYMDQRVIHRMIDLGFNIGLHGHHHFPAATPFEIRSPWETSMALISAGSLAVGSRELPEGEKRQFNVVDIHPDCQSIVVHVRAMSSDGIFARSYRDDFGGKSSKELRLPSPTGRRKRPDSSIQVDDAMTALKEARYEEALVIAERFGSSFPSQSRLIRAKAFECLGRREDLIKLLDPPQTADETVQVAKLLIDDQRLDDVARLLEDVSGWLDQIVVRELEIALAVARSFS